MDRESPHLFLWYADEFLEAADVVRLHKNGGEIPTGVRARFEDPFVPAYYLHGHAIELALKGYLRHRGRSENQVRSRPFGHDLVALLNECKSEKLEDVMSLTRADEGGRGRTRADEEVVTLLNERYAVKRLEYGEVGAYQLPETSPT